MISLILWWKSIRIYAVLAFGYIQMKFFTLVSYEEENLVTIWRYNPIKDWFPFYDIEFSLRNHIYYISGHVFLLIVFWFVQQFCTVIKDLMNMGLRMIPCYIFEFIDKIKFMFQCFFYLELIDLIDYFLIFNQPFANVGGWPLEYNDIKLVLVILIIIFTWKRRYFIGQWESLRQAWAGYF